MGYGNLVPLGFPGSADDHFVGNGIGKDNQKVRASHFLFQGTVFLGKHLGFAAISLADVFVLTLHAFVSADNYNTHSFSLSGDAIHMLV